MEQLDRVIVLGQGYVGLPVALRAVAAGYSVVGFDLDSDRVRELAGGRSPIEDVTDQELGSALSTGRFVPSSDPEALAGFDVAVIAVPTPLRDGSPDLSAVESAARLVAMHLRRDALVVLESTTYPGTTEEVLVPLLEDGSGLKAGVDFAAGFSPERIDPGNREFRLANTPKVIAGLDARSLGAMERFYGRLVDKTVPVSSPKVAELSKLLENTFRHVNIALVNELTVLAHELEIDVWEAIDAAATKPFGFMRFEPGPGVGGHCLPIDPSYLSWQVQRALGESFRFIELARDVNHKMPDYVVRRLMLAMNEREMAIRGRRILLLGLAYKRNTGDVRESPAVAVAERLVRLGAVVVAADPHVQPAGVPMGVELVEATPTEAARADAVVLLVDHAAFDVEALTRAAPYVFDTRRRADGPNVERL